ncbi:MAG: hypothetical protein IJ464_02140 [Alistipes sp.]|nr:hypothetical protein [Alistipes sp.]
MINRLLGTLCALAIIAVMAFAVLNYGNYTSLCFNQKVETAAESTPTHPEPTTDAVIETTVEPLSEPVVEETQSLPVEAETY